MTIVYEDSRVPTTSVRRDDILNCQDVKTLIEWLHDLREQSDNIRGQIESRMLTETDDDDWLVRVGDKLGYSRKGEAAVRRRLMELGVTPPDTDQEIRELKDKCRELKMDCTRAQFFVRAAHRMLDKDTISDIRRLAKTFMEERIMQAEQEHERYVGRIFDPTLLET